MDIIQEEWDSTKDNLVAQLKQLIKDRSEQSETYRIMIYMLESPKTRVKTRTKNKDG